jgi:hypothetical protein
MSASWAFIDTALVLWVVVTSADIYFSASAIFPTSQLQLEIDTVCTFVTDFWVAIERGLCSAASRLKGAVMYIAGISRGFWCDGAPFISPQFAFAHPLLIDRVAVIDPGGFCALDKQPGSGGAAAYI